MFLPSQIAAAARDEVSHLGEEVISERIFSWITDAERNKPYLKGSGRDAFGNWTGELVTSEGWRQLQKFGIEKGMIATGYDEKSTLRGPHARALQFLRLQIWVPSCANVTCPSAMQDGAARLLQLHLNDPVRAAQLESGQRHVFEDAFRRLTSRDPAIAWTSGQWMTERTGGSDVSRTETTAAPRLTGDSASGERSSLGRAPWSINGFKWFSSATDSNMTILLARTPEGRLSAFLAPLRVSADSKELNGVRIQRLKDKVGTAPLPTAELVLEDMKAWMIGKEGHGIHEISTVLTITRVHSVIAAVGYVGRGLDIARAFSLVREVGTGKGGRVSLAESPLHLRTLARMTVEYRGLMLLAMYTAYILGVTEHPGQTDPDLSPALRALTPPPAQATALLRVLTQVAKAYICKTSVPLVFACMESLGGVGYLNNADQEELNLSRLWRDCGVLPIWEGTTDVLSTDLIRALKHPKFGSESLEALGGVVKMASTAFEGQRQQKAGWDPSGLWETLEGEITSKPQAEQMGDARDYLWRVAKLLIGVLLQTDACRDDDAVAVHIFEEFVGAEFGVAGRRGALSTQARVEMDGAVVFGRRIHTNKADSKL